MAGLASSFSSFTYDVFLSFRGSDTRHGFTGFLYKALHDSGIRTFIDNEELHGGDEIAPSLVKAIKESRIAIIVLSNNYASSTFCLDELSNIIDCIKRKGRLVLPVFYCVDPSYVRYQRGTYGEALARHEEKFKDNKGKVLNWRMALHQTANLSGWHFKHGDGYEHEFIGKIVEEVSRKIKRVALPVADCPVGLESQVVNVNLLLDVGSNDEVHMVGIYGIGGIGKTTLALAVHNSIADHFEGLCFLENVRENSNKHGLVHLQKIILSEIVGEKKIKLASVKQGISIIQHRLRQKKVLLILDDVDKREQLQAIAGRVDWFGPGSRVIITTRDRHLLACHNVERTYEVKELNKKDAFELLRWKAFKADKVRPSYAGILNRAVTYACGLPLALEVIGSNLFGKNIEEWESALNRYERIPNNKILKILKVSFDALEEDEQCVFLDIACCFNRYELAEVIDILRAHYGECMKHHIAVLVEKSLLKISWDNKVTLHDLIEKMGKEIVRQESPKEPGKRSRLWFPKDIVQVLEENTGTTEIEIIYLDSILFEEVAIEWNGKAFKKMKNLKTLIIRNGRFSNSPQHLPNSLKILEWWRYPSQYLPFDFHPKKLVICKLPNSYFTSLELANLMKKFVNLRVLNFDDTKCLTQIPDLSGLRNLEKLSFRYCENLITIHDSVGFLDKLKILNAEYCNKLRSFPPIKLTSLQQLELSNCDSLVRFPKILGKMENLTGLYLKKTPIKELPFSFRNLTRLRRLCLTDCGVVQLPSSIIMMSELTEIMAWGWQGWLSPKQDGGKEKVSSMVSSNVERLHLSSCNLSNDFFQEIRGIPPNLEHFSAANCKSLTSSSRSMLLNQELHEAGNTEFYLPGATIPKWFEHQSRGSSISFWFRDKFPAISLCLVIGHYFNFMFGSPTIIINGKQPFFEHQWSADYFLMERRHTYLFDLQKIKLEDNLNEALLENEWNHAVVTYKDGHEIPILLESGIHVFTQESSMEDIRFTDPYKKRKVDADLNCSQS